MTNEDKQNEPKEKKVNKYARRTGPPRIGVKQVEGHIVGRDKKIIPPLEVQKLAQLGCRDQEICSWFGIDEHTLTYNFRDQLDLGRVSLKQSLRRAQISLALSGHATMLIFLGKNYLGQSDQPLDTEINQPLPWSDDSI
jgi:hypothetical protein